jgi:ribosomal protein S18 acetylase RimI-like enzyme
MSYDRQTVDGSPPATRGFTVRSLFAFDDRAGVVGMTSFGKSRIEDRPAFSAPFLSAVVGLRLGEIFTLDVHPDHQDKGIGRQLMAAAFAGLRERGLGKAYLWFSTAIPRAISTSGWVDATSPTATRTCGCRGLPRLA